MHRDYFKGPVAFVDQGFFRATYSVNGDVNNIIKVTLFELKYLFR